MKRIYQLAGIALLAAALHGCVFQPIHVEVYIPTTVQTGGDIVLDTVGNKLSEVSK